MPIQSTTELANLALRFCGVSQEIQDLDTERSKEAAACRRFYQPVLEEVLGVWPWPFATQFVTLSALSAAPTTEWAYAYRYPANTLTLHRVLNGFSRRETNWSRVPYRIASDDVGKLVLCDLSPAVAEVTVLVTDVTQYDGAFVQAFAHRLAADIALTLAGADKLQLRQTEMQAYAMAVMTAQARAANEETADPPMPSELIQARDGFPTYDCWPPRYL